MLQDGSIPRKIALIPMDLNSDVMRAFSTLSLHPRVELS